MTKIYTFVQFGRYCVVCFGLILLCSMTMVVSAQSSVISLPYETGFEDVQESSQWQFANVPPSLLRPNDPPPFTTHWTVGQQDSRFGSSSLYVVNDEGMLGYEEGTYSIMAYRSFNLPQGVYDISFDVKVGGSTAVSGEGLYAAWIPQDQVIEGNTSSGIPAYVSDNLLSGYPTDGWKNNSYFQHITSSVSVTQAGASVGGYNLVFMWKSVNGHTPTDYSAAIDNILITARVQNNACLSQPSDLDYRSSNGVGTISWRGNADSYDIILCEYYSNSPVFEQTGLTNLSLQFNLSDIPEGVYNFRVRANCNGEVSQWAEYNDILIYDPSYHCLDFINFRGEGVQCQYGKWSTYGGRTSTVTGYSPSHITYHYKNGETDPRTNNKLTTKPEGSIAAVRLGNWDTDSEWESVTYTLNVTPEIGVLQLRYAVVLENPNHDEYDQPRFTLEILKADDTPIDPTCGQADFKAGFGGAATWNKEEYKEPNSWGGYTTYNIDWKDWTLVGLNLKDYIGEVIKIRLTTYDCALGAHFGYAYFTLDCSTGNIQGVTCGEKPRSMTVDEGFRYRWYKPNNPDEPFYDGQDPTSRELYISEQDSNFYACDLISLVNENCYFTLTASAMKQYPRAKTILKHAPEKCRNLVRIDNESAVYGYYIDEETGVEDSVKVGYCETYSWYIVKEDGTEELVSKDFYPDPIEMPEEGGLLTLKLKVTMADGHCEDEYTITYDVPAIGSTEEETTRYICKGGSIDFEDNTYYEEGDYTVYYTNWAGCDSILTLHLIELSADTIYSDTIICFGQTYHWGGQEITQSGVYYDNVLYQTRVTDCDSLILVRTVTVLDPLLAELGSIPDEICGDDEVLPLSFYVNSGIAGYYSLIFDSIGHAGGFEDRIEVAIEANEKEVAIDVHIGGENGRYKRPDTYKATLLIHDFNLCQNVEFPIEFDVLYPDTILLQLWDDVLSVTNPRWNGGYEFTAFQWCKDGQPIPGQTDFRLYIEGQKLDTTAEYSVLLTRADDGVTISTCGYQPYSVTEEESEKLVFSLETISDSDAQVQMITTRPAMVSVYNALGILCSVNKVDGESRIKLPSQKGLYIVSVTDNDGIRETYSVIVR